MYNFKKGDEVKNITTHKIKEVEPSINSIYIDAIGWVDADFYELVQPKTVYENKPHKHAAMICHVANEGVVIDKTDLSIINNVSQSKWYLARKFEIVLHKTKNEIRIDKLEKMVDYHKDAVDVISKELKILKNN